MINVAMSIFCSITSVEEGRGQRCPDADIERGRRALGAHVPVRVRVLSARFNVLPRNIERVR
jgi:hypothetical protein